MLLGIEEERGAAARFAAQSRRARKKYRATHNPELPYDFKSWLLLGVFGHLRFFHLLPFGELLGSQNALIAGVLLRL